MPLWARNWPSVALPLASGLRLIDFKTGKFSCFVLCYIRSAFLVVASQHVYVINHVIILSSAPPICCAAHAQNQSALQVAFMLYVT